MKILRFFQTRLASASAGKAFTLIELLVVISIIAILAGLLFPVMGAVRTQARKASAKNDVTQIVVAVKNYYTDYGKYPLADGTVDDTVAFGKTNSNKALFDVLVSGTGTLNPRQIRYLEVPDAKVKTAPKSGLGPTDSSSPGVWFDPWGNPYAIFIDGNYDNSVTPTTTELPGITSTALRTGVAAGSKGPDGTPASPVISWQ